MGLSVICAHAALYKQTRKKQEFSVERKGVVRLARRMLKRAVQKPKRRKYVLPLDTRRRDHVKNMTSFSSFS